MTTADHLKIILERAEAACAGPWTAEPDDTWWLEGVEHRVVRAPNDHEAAFSHDGDAEFIAHARTDLPRLLDAVGAVLRVADALDTIATERSLSARILGPSFKEVARNIREAINGALEKP